MLSDQVVRARTAVPWCLPELRCLFCIRWQSMERAMTGLAEPNYIEKVRLIVAIMMMRFDSAFSLAFGTNCRPCQLSSLDRIVYGDAGSSEHSGVFKVAFAPYFLSLGVPFIYFLRIFFLVPVFNNSAFFSVLFLPLCIIGCMVCWVFVRHTTILSRI